MVLVMHYPNTEEKQKELAQRAAILHAKVVIDHINALPCTYEDKMNLLDQIKKLTKGTLLSSGLVLPVPNKETYYSHPRT